MGSEQFGLFSAGEHRLLANVEVVDMKYSSNNLQGVPLPLPCKIKIGVEYRPGGVLKDYSPMVYTLDPEAAADEIVRSRGWDQFPGYQPADVWVDVGF